MKAEYSDLYEKLGLNIVYYRKRKKYTQFELAEIIGVDRSHISSIELGKIGPSMDVVFALCKALEVEPNKLFDFRD